MADSLLDFGNIAQLAQNQLRNTMAMQQLGMQREGLDLRNREIGVHEKQLAFQAEQDKRKRFQELYEFSKDPRVTANPELEDAIFDQMGTVSGSPQISGESNKIGREARRKMYSGMIKGNLDEAEDGFVELAVRSSPQDLDKIIESTSSFQQTREKVDAIKVHREFEAARYQQLQSSVVKVEEGQPRYTASSMDFRDALRGTELPKFERVLASAERLAAKGGKASLDIAALFGKNDFPQLLGGNNQKIAEFASQKQEEFKGLALMSTKMLEDSERGGTELSHASKAALRERIALGAELSQSYEALSAWGHDPLNRDKLKAAQKAGRAIEENRLAMGKLKISNGEETTRIKQDAFAFRQSEAGLKHQYEKTVADGQQVFAALPSNQQTPQQAAHVAQQLRESTGVSVKVEDIMKGIANPNKPLVESKVVVDATDRKLGEQMAKDVGEIIRESHGSALGAADILDGVTRIRTAMAGGNVTLGPTATLRNKGNQIMEMLGIAGKDTAERLVNTRQTIKALAQFSINARKLLRGQGQVTENEQKLLIKAESGEIDDFTLPELKTVMDVTDRLARKSYDRHQTNLEKARSNSAASHLVPFYELDKLPPQQSGAAPPSKKPDGKATPQKHGGATLKSLPEGAKQIGTSGGKPVYQTPDGKKWIGE